MKSLFFILVGSLLFGLDAFAELVVIRCDKEIGVTLSSDWNSGTVSLFNNAAVNLYTLKQAETNSQGVRFKATKVTPFGELELFITHPIAVESSKAYTISIILDGEEKGQAPCTSDE